ncbi:unnamed protein product [Effrenium voratum]|uniref:Heme NO-binding domain-containing protein n=1 Tax=Effrenium voratum TaxID=2562239 RepID=A0AA36IJ97_9DINO|nr:unnamed protein product [Effrenium voratum]
MLHGLIHVVFRDFVLDNFGDAAWKKILARAGIENAATILEMKHYDDNLTFTAVKIGAEVAGAPLDAALELFGGYFVDFAIRSGFMKLLRSLGGNLHEFLGNLNILHHNVERDLPAAIFPLFEVGSLTTYEEGHYSFRVDYASSRPGLDALLKGALTRVALKLFQSDLEVDTKLKVGVSGGFSTEEKVANELHWQLTVRKPDKPHAEEKVELPQGGYSFFDFHSALTSYMCCQCERDEPESMVLVNTKPIMDEKEDWEQEVAAILREKRRQLEPVIGGKACPDEQHLYFHLNEVERVQVGAVLFRASSADQVSSPWTASELEDTEYFWGAYTKLDNFYAKSEDWLLPSKTPQGIKYEKRDKVRFLSQSWGIPKEWDELMGSCSYAQAKAAEICCVSKDLAARDLGSTSRWKEVFYWVDKCCIPQGDQELTGWCVNLLEEYIIFCDGLVVLVPWTYFTRLWCVYEWVCFLLVHSPMDIEICADPFMRDSTMPLFLDAIGNFKLANCQCFREDDRPVLFNKVAEYYKSVEHFEVFLKFTAIALFARCTAQRRSGKATSALEPWRYLAERQGFTVLAKKLEEMKTLLPKWRQYAVEDAEGGSGGGTHDVQTAVLKQVEAWFEKDICPLINKRRQESCSVTGMQKIEALRRAAGKVLLQEKVSSL